ncbi:hypothetical protein M747DRAFT_291580 [Aspergillus niger ATCC 13496]|uniref:Uncharacterized protein n=1 Tax=Aspergillus niger ATCC 13496 TaxID=1353008 RepID=A0A370CDK8_ASPNG|nr:hypothetical protein M747DRAFT_291580 [Aspergillus niger ATCC 13496]
MTPTCQPKTQLYSTNPKPHSQLAGQGFLASLSTVINLADPGIPTLPSTENMLGLFPATGTAIEPLSV